MKISEQRSNDYYKNGAVCLPELIPADWVERLREEVNELNSRYQETTPLGQSCILVKQGGSMFMEFMSRDLDTFAHLQEEVNIGGIIGELIGAQSVRFWRDEIHFKRPLSSGNATPWHHGIASNPFKGEQTPTVWIPLAEINADQSPLKTIKGSHLNQEFRFCPPTRGESSPKQGYQTIIDFDRLVEEKKVDVQTWCVKPGDGVVFHPFTIHAADPNISDRYRAAFVMRWIGETAQYEPDEYSIHDPLLTSDVWNNPMKRNDLMPVRWQRGI